MTRNEEQKNERIEEKRKEIEKTQVEEKKQEKRKVLSILLDSFETAKYYLPVTAVLLLRGQI